MFEEEDVHSVVVAGVAGVAPIYTGHRLDGVGIVVVDGSEENFGSHLYTDMEPDKEELHLENSLKDSAKPVVSGGPSVTRSTAKTAESANATLPPKIPASISTENGYLSRVVEMATASVTFKT